MQIKVVKTEYLSERMERWQIELPKACFMEFGFYVEALDGVALHRRSYEADNLMEVDAAIGFKDELLDLIAALQKQN
jgi:hypothetical protein